MKETTLQPISQWTSTPDAGTWLQRQRTNVSIVQSSWLIHSAPCRPGSSGTLADSGLDFGKNLLALPSRQGPGNIFVKRYGNDQGSTCRVLAPLEANALRIVTPAHPSEGVAVVLTFTPVSW